jgi:hypothetical protein
LEDDEQCKIWYVAAEGRVLRIRYILEIISSCKPVNLLGIQSSALAPIQAREGAHICGSSCRKLQMSGTKPSAVPMILTSGNIIRNPKHIWYANYEYNIVEVEFWGIPPGRLRKGSSSPFIRPPTRTTKRNIFPRTRNRRVNPCIYRWFICWGTGTRESRINRVHIIDALDIREDAHYAGIAWYFNAGKGLGEDEVYVFADRRRQKGACNERGGKLHRQVSLYWDEETWLLLAYRGVRLPASRSEFSRGEADAPLFRFISTVSTTPPLSKIPTYCLEIF